MNTEKCEHSLNQSEEIHIIVDNMELVPVCRSQIFKMTIFEQFLKARHA